MTGKQAIDLLIYLRGEKDVEKAHSDADAVLCALLRSLGQSEVVFEWCKIKKWYA